MGATRDLTTIGVDAELLARTRDAMTSAAGAGDGEVAELAMRFFLGLRALDESQSISELSEDEAMRVAYEELHAMRRERRSAA